MHNAGFLSPAEFVLGPSNKHGQRVLWSSVFRLPKTLLYMEKSLWNREPVGLGKGVVRTEGWLSRGYDLVGRDWTETESLYPVWDQGGNIGSRAH